MSFGANKKPNKPGWVLHIPRGIHAGVGGAEISKPWLWHKPREMALPEPLCMLKEGNCLSQCFSDTLLQVLVSQAFTFHLHWDQHE